jgi:Cu2+-exporting ATPase
MRSKIHENERFRDKLLSSYSVVSTEYDDVINQVKLADLASNDRLFLKKGMIVPVDCYLDSDGALFDDSILSGRTTPKQYKKGEILTSGFQCATDNVTARVKNSYADSYLYQLDEKLDAFAALKAPIEDKAIRWLKYLMPIMFLIALIAGIVAGVLINPFLGVKIFILLLVSICPCTLGMITPVSLHVGIQRLKKLGVQFNHPGDIELASEVDTLVFDINGTLTEDRPTIVLFEEKATNELDIGSIIASLENNQSHPYAKLLMDKFNDKTIQKMTVTSEQGGLFGALNGVTYYLGNMDFLQSKFGTGIVLDHHKIAGESAIYLSDGISILAKIVFSDPLKKDAIAVVNALSQHKILCTGADKVTAEAVADTLNIPRTQVFFNQTPEAKVALIKALKEGRNPNNSNDNTQYKKRVVAMVGDGGNDTGALTEADFAILVRSQLTKNPQLGIAKAIIDKRYVLPLLHLMQLSKRTKYLLRFNFTVSFIYNVSTVGVSLALLFLSHLVLPPGIGVLLMILQAVIILVAALIVQHLPVTALPDLNSTAMSADDDLSLSNITFETQS